MTEKPIRYLNKYMDAITNENEESRTSDTESTVTESENTPYKIRLATLN